MGGKHAIKQFKKSLILKNNHINETSIFNWKNKNSDKLIEKLINDFEVYFDKK